MVTRCRVEIVSLVVLGLLVGGCGSDDTTATPGTGGGGRDGSALTGGTGGRTDGGNASDGFVCPCPHGTCTTGSACICDPGYIGALCDTACACVHGTCGEGGACMCDTGFVGATCSTCAPQHFGPTCQACNCGDRGCSDGISGTGVCSACPIGFAGTNCTECASGYFGSTCQPCTCVNGACKGMTTGDGTCSACDTGWSGANCTDCAAGYWGATCQACPSCGANGTCNEGKTGNGGCTCSNAWSGATCTECASGYWGSACQTCPSCGDHGTCSDGRTGSGECTCAPAWAGTTCTTCAAGYWGTNCDACACKHGTCDSATGHCSSCDAAWSGTDCDTCPTCQTGLVLYWKFDESSGPTAFDSTSNHFDGTYFSLNTLLPTPSMEAPPLVRATGSDPYSILLAGGTINTASRQAVTYKPADSSALKPANDFTMSAWFRTTGTDTNGSEVLSMGDNYLLRLRKPSTTSTTYQLQYSKLYQTGIASDGGIAATYADCQGPLVPATAFLDGNWHHLVGTQSSSTGMAMYLDGALVTVTGAAGTANCANSAAATNTSNVVYVLGRSFWVGRNGNTSGSFDFDGNIDEVRVYNRVLTPAEILTLAQGAL